jgi:hypothetical protein
VDPLFVAVPSEESISAALRLWPELGGKRIRPLLVTAFGDIYVETSTGEVWAAQPLELICEKVASSVDSLQAMFSDAEWARERLLTELALLAQEQGKTRLENQVFAVAPHPCLGGEIRAGNLMAMDLEVWHHICSEIRPQVQGRPSSDA